MGGARSKCSWLFPVCGVIHSPSQEIFGPPCTDVGAPLSHAAIVARELGIPAVVGCGNATTLLHSGDWIRVDWGAGTVEILDRVWHPA